MRYARYIIIICMVGLAFVAANAFDLQNDSLILWYDRPSTDWNEALPVGNGKLGAMIFGRVDTERIQLNEESVWSGADHDFVNPNARKSLPQVRKLLFEGKYFEAKQLAQSDLMGNKRIPSAYQTLGDLELIFDHDPSAITDYHRELNLHTAVSKVSYRHKWVSYERQIFANAPDNVIVMRIKSGNPGSISFKGIQSRPGNAAQFSNEGGQIVMYEHIGNGTGVKVVSRAAVLTRGGAVNITGSEFRVSGADEVLILLTAATDYAGADPFALTKKNLENALQKGFTGLYEDHIRDYTRFFNRVKLDLGTTDAIHFPTDQRLNALRRGNKDPHLISLYFQYGRYLLISSSRPGGLPANLQGIWADGLNPPWNADYHININIQMNYWPAEVTNLAEMHEPFLRFLDKLRIDGHKTAKAMYGVDGAVAHFTTDAWHFTEPYGQTQWAMWPMGLAWSANHLWEHYLFANDKKFLADLAYPVMKDAALFCVNWLVEDPVKRQLVSGPSISPENTFKTEEGKTATMVMGPTMDHMIIRQLLRSTILAGETLNVDAALRKKFANALGRIAPTKLTTDGRIMEWTADFEEAEPGHRHISHLYGLHPGNEITAQHSPELMKAARKTIDYRLKHGGGHTGWSRAWIINFFARLGDGDAANDNLYALLSKSTLPNLFDNHPPFQIDGNFGGSAGIAEMLLQSHSGEVQLLPALPHDWANGSVSGLRARGGFEISMVWDAGNLVSANVKSMLGGPLRIRLGTTLTEIETTPGGVYVLDANLAIIR